jgi:hypothetical protein
MFQQAGYFLNTTNCTHLVGQTDHIPTKLDEPTESCRLLVSAAVCICMTCGCSLTRFLLPIMFVSPAQIERWDDDTDILHARHQQQTGSIALPFVQQNRTATAWAGVGGSVIHSVARILVLFSDFVLL